jgi:hypothetical protein
LFNYYTDDAIFITKVNRHEYRKRKGKNTFLTEV